MNNIDISFNGYFFFNLISPQQFPGSSDSKKLQIDIGSFPTKHEIILLEMAISVYVNNLIDHNFLFMA